MSRTRALRVSFLPTALAAAVFFATCCPQPQSSHPYIILYAFSDEGVLLSERMTVDTAYSHLGRDVKVGTIAGKEIVLAESGTGTTNAAAMAQSLIDRYQPTAVIMTGIAGAIDTSVHIGDITACSVWVQHDFGYIGAEGFKSMPLETLDPVADSVSAFASFLADSPLLNQTRTLPTDSLELRKIGDRSPRLITGGVGVTGNTFIDSKEKRDWLSSHFNALVTDMESVAVAHVCTSNDVPFVIFRSASDLAGGSGSETARQELEQFFKVAADNSSQVVLELLRKL